jgi:hypothetical protein
MSLFSDLLGGAAQYLNTEDTLSTIRNYPTQVMDMTNQVATAAKEAGEFKPYTVTTGAGGASFGQEGMTQQLSPEAQALQQSLYGQAAAQAQNLGSVTPESLMAQMDALRQPQQMRDQLALENRMAAQGRLGLSSNAYGGATPEQLAMAQAQEQQRSADALNAITQARAIQGQDITNIGGMLTAAGVPQSQLTASLNPALAAMQYADPAQAMLQSKIVSNLGQQAVSGIPSMINAEAALKQAQMQSLLSSLGIGATGAAGAAGGDATNWLDTGIDWLSGLFSGNTGTMQQESNGTNEFNVGEGVSGDASLNAMLGIK